MLAVSLVVSMLWATAGASDFGHFVEDEDGPVHPFTYEYQVIGDLDDEPGYTPHVVGGDQASAGEWDDTVGIVMYGSYVGCTGTLIGPKLVLTAAHCMDGGVSHVILKSKDWRRDDGELIEVKAGWGNRGYQGWGSDIAVITLEERASVEPRMVASDCIIDTYLRKRAEVAIVGFGNINEEGGRSTTRLNVGYSTVANPDCDKQEINGFYAGCDPYISPGGEIAAGGDGVDACFGDSGGPLYLLTEEGDFLVGVTSRSLAGVPSSQPCKYGGIWTRPDYFLDWIETTSGMTVARPQCNDAPTASTTNIVTSKNTEGSTVVEVQDPDGSNHTLSVAVAPANGEVTLDGDTIIYMPDEGFVGDDPFVIAVTDDGSPYEASPPITVDLDMTAKVVWASCGGCSGSPAMPAGASAFAMLSWLVGRRRRTGLAR
jgi:secreted trypsin-like serine protease